MSEADTIRCGTVLPPVPGESLVALQNHACALPLGHLGIHKCQFSLAYKGASCCAWSDFPTAGVSEVL
jgi:hypothetical protein